jgi:DNA end-binding protein Ku
MAARSIASLNLVRTGLDSGEALLATEATCTISFNMLHKGCGSRLKQYICLRRSRGSARGHRQGYEFAKDQYVIFTPEELKAMEEAGTHMAEITEFVPLEAVDPVYFDKVHCARQGRREADALLAAALRESNRCALGRWPPAASSTS